MKLHSRVSRLRILALAAVVLVTTGITAAPLRNAVSNVFSNPIGSWSLKGSQAKAAAPVAARQASTSAETELRALFEVTPTHLDYSVATSRTSLIDLAIATEHTRGRAGAANGERGSWRLVQARGGRWLRAARASGFGGARFGGGGAIAILGRPGSARAGGGSRGSAAANSSPAPGNRPGADRPGARPIFNEHRNGLGKLTGKHPASASPGVAAAGGLGGHTNLSSTPEPSTLILFGTGLATAVGTIRRRLRRQ